MTSLNKYIADSGFCSRREADEYIANHRVTINGRVAKAGNRVEPGDKVEIDGEPFGKKNTKKKGPLYIAFHKPKGITTTTDARDATSITTYINHPERIFPVGRLDKDSEGLILMTSDGDIVNKILRAGNSHEKEYIVTTEQPVTPGFLAHIRAGVRIPPDGTTLPCKAAQESKHSFRITLTQGLNRQIRRMCGALDFRVTKLMRVRIMNVRLTGLESGHWRYLTAEELAGVQEAIAGSSGTEEASKVRRVRRAAVPEPADKPDVGNIKAPHKPSASAKNPADVKAARSTKSSPKEKLADRKKPRDARPASARETARVHETARASKTTRAPKTTKKNKEGDRKKPAGKSSYKDYRERR